MHSCCAGTFVFTDCALDVNSVSITGICVGYNRHIDPLRDITEVGNHLGHAGEAYIGKSNLRGSPMACHVHCLGTLSFGYHSSEAIIYEWS